MKKQLLLILLMLVTGYAFAQWSINPKVNTPVAVRENSQSGNVSVSDGTGGVIIVYTESIWDSSTSQTFSQIYAQRLNANGVAQWGTHGKLITTVPDYTYPVVATDGNNGAVILWEKQNTNGAYDLRKLVAQRINTNGDKQWGANGIEITPTASEYWANEIMFDNNGFVFIYGAEDHCYVQKLNMSGALQWGANGIKINDAAMEYDGGGIIKDGTGYLIVFTEEYEFEINGEEAEGVRLLWQKLNADGSKNGTNLLLETLEPSLAVPYRFYPGGLVADGNGGIYYTIEAEKGDDTEVKLYLQHVNSNGVKQFNSTTWGMLVDASIGKFVASGGGAYIDYSTSLTSDDTGGVVLAWTDERSGIYGLYAQRFNSTGAKIWNSGVDVLVMQGNVTRFYDGYIKTNAEGNFVFMIPKNQEDGSSTNLYVQKLSAANGAFLYPVQGVLASSRKAEYEKSGVEMVVLSDKVVLVWSQYSNGGNLQNDIYAQSVYNNGELTPPINFGSFSVINTRTLEGFNSIQAAIDDTDTQNGDELRIAPGTYTESATITKQVSIYGNNVGSAPWNWSKPATIIKPAVTAFTYANALITASANNIIIDGISFDGTNDLINDNAPRTINGKAARTAFGVAMGESSIYQTPTITNNKFENFTGRAIEVWSDISDLSMEVSNNQIDNVVGINNNNAFGIYANNYGGEIKNNRITRALTGIYTQFTRHIGYNSNFKTLNNTVEAYYRGIWATGAITVAAPPIEIADNAVNKADFSAMTADGFTANINLTGMLFNGLAGNNNVLVNNNNVSGANWGINTSLIQKSGSNPDRFIISGGTLNNNYIGVDNYIATNNNYATRVVLSGVTITNSGLTGVRNYATDGTYKSELILKDGVQILHSSPTATYENAISIYGANAELNELNDTKISGAYKNFISFVSASGNAPMNGKTVNGENVTYDGAVDGYTFNNYKPSALFDLTLRDVVKARIYDGDNTANITAGKVLIHSAFPLPVNLLNFNAALKNNSALLTWATASELNNKHFVLEKSLDGTTFQPIATVDGKGTTSIKSNYQFTDVNFFQSAYYRLTQVDLNGTKVTYHDLVRHVKSLDAQAGVKVYPNPTTDKIFVSTTDMKTGSVVKLINLQGKVLASQNANQPILTFEAQQLPAGLYFVQYSNGTGVQTQKVVKK